MHNHLVKAPGTGSVEAAGDLRRWDESVDQLSLIVAADQAADTMKHALRAPLLAEVTSRGKQVLEGRLASGLPLRVQIVSPSAYASTLLRATGSAAHVEHLERLARERGVELSGESEADIYRGLGLPFIPPELREDQGEIEAALSSSVARRSRHRGGSQGARALSYRVQRRPAHRRGDGAGRRCAGDGVHDHHRPFAGGGLCGRPLGRSAQGSVGGDRARPGARVGAAPARNGIRHPGRRQRSTIPTPSSSSST